jgi:hypothetical protein
MLESGLKAGDQILLEGIQKERRMTKLNLKLSMLR